MNKPVYVQIDLKRIFTTLPNTKKEKCTLLIVMIIVFIIFFGPLCFTEIPPLQAILLSCLPTLSISWGWIVLLRGLFRKKDFSLKSPTI